MGAVSYRWACDGQVIDGETGASLTVTWRKPSCSHVYSATPVYSVYGWPTDGQTVSTTVTFKPNGLLLIFR